MQSGRGDTLEERYAIKLCFKLGKNATETYGMLQTAFHSFHILSVLFCGQPGQQSPQFGKFSIFVVDYDNVWSSGRDYVIRLYLKIPENFERLIFQDVLLLFTPLEFFTSVLADGFSLEFE